MEQSKERPVFTEHPPMSKIIRAEATKFPVLDQAQPKSAKKLYDAFHDNTDDTVERYDNKRFSVCGIIKSIGADEHGKPSIQLSDELQELSYVLCVFSSNRELNNLRVGESITVCGNYLIISTALGVILKNCELIN